MSRSLIVALMCILLALPSIGPLLGPVDEGVEDGLVQADEQTVADAVPRDLGRLLEGVAGDFVENRGQVANADVRYYAKGDRLTVGLTPTGVVMTVREERLSSVTDRSSDESPARMAMTFGIDFVGCVPVEPQGRGAPGHLSNYFLGNDPDRWVRGAPSYPEVLYKGLWPGVDLRFHLTDGMLKYEYMVDAGADPGRITMEYEGVEGLSLDGTSGDLLVRLPTTTLRDMRPIVLQDGVLPAKGAAGEFDILEGNMVRFVLPKDCILESPLVIDPGLEFSTFFGGSLGEEGCDIALDDDGDVYLVGNTASDDLRVTPGVYDTTMGGQGDIFVARFDPTLSTLKFATYIGGYSQVDNSVTIEVVDGEGIYTCGYTESPDFPTTPGVIAPTSPGGADGFLLLLSLDGRTLLKSTFIGGSDLDSTKALDIDANGNIYLSGRTLSVDLPTTPGAYDRTFGGGTRGDAYVMKVSKAMDQILFCTYLGGPGEEYYITLRLDDSDNVYVIGRTQSRFFPTTAGAYCRTLTGEYDCFISKLSPDGSTLLNSTFIGGTMNETNANDIQFMGNGSVVVLMNTVSSDFPVTPNAICGTKGPGSDMALVMMDANLSRLQFSTFLGGDGENRVLEIARDPGGEVLYMAGYSSSTNLPCTVGAYDSRNRGSYDLIVLGVDLRTLTWTYLTYLGGQEAELMLNGAIAIDGSGRLLIVGHSYSDDFPATSKANQTYNNGNYDAVALRIEPAPCGTPDGPTGLVATASDGYVDLAWTVPTNESYRLLSQRLYKGTSPDDISEAIELDLDSGYRDTGVTNGVTYYYQVVTLNSAGESGRPTAVNATPLGPPSAPLDLVATTGNGTIELAWQRPTELGGRLGGYHVLRGLAIDALEHLVSIDPTESYLDADVDMGTTYYYAVMAYNALFNGTASKVVRIKAQGLPSAPTDLTAVSGNHSLGLSWSAPVEDGGSTLLAFYIYTSPTGDGWTFLATVLPTTPAYSHLGLENGLTYHYRVTAVSIVGEGPPSEPVGASPIGAPGMPRGVVATGLDGSIRLTWETPTSDGGSPVTGYRVYGGSLVDALGLLHAGDALTRDFTHAPVPNGHTRYYAVSALNAEGEGERSPIVQATTMGLPSAPLDLTAAISYGTVRLSWAPPEDDGGSPSLTYRVLRGTSPGALSPLATLEEVLELTDPDVSKGASYYYEVVAINIRGGAGSPSGVVRVDMLGLPGVPVNVTAIARDRTVSLAWGPPSVDPDAPVEAYAVLRGTSAGDLQEIARVRVMLYDDRDPTLVNGVLYYYAISAINEIGEGGRTAPVPAKPLPPPGAPTLTASEDDGEVVLEWTAPTGDAAAAIGYLLYRGTDLSDLKVVAELGTVTTYTDTYLKPGQTYHYRVRATSLSGEGAMSEPVSVELPQEVGEATWLMPALIGLIIIVALLAGALMMRGRGGAKGGTE